MNEKKVRLQNHSWQRTDLYRLGVEMEEIKLNTIDEAIEDIKQGKLIIVVDDEDRENEGDFVMATELVTPEAVNFMITHGKGLVCVSMPEQELTRLGIDLMVSKNSDSFKTAFTTSVDHVTTKTGISAFERAETLKQLTNPESKPADFNRPGHIFPLQVQHGGVLSRPGHTEASSDLAKMAGLFPSGTICEIVNPDGTMARLPQIMKYAKEWNLKVVSVAELIDYIKKNNVKLYSERKYDARLLAESTLPTAFGEFNLFAFDNFGSDEPNLALIKGNPSDFKDDVLVRVHSECFTGDIFASSRCDCGAQLHESMRRIQEAGQGMIIYLRQEGRGIGLVNKIRAYKLQEGGYDTVEANHKLGFASDLRDFKSAADILKFFGVNSIRLLTNNPLKIKDLEKHGIKVTSREEIEIPAHHGNHNYLKTKKEKMNHILKLV